MSLATPRRRDFWSGTPWYTHREIERRFNNVSLIDTPRLDAVIEGLSRLQRLGLSVRQQWLLARYYGSVIEKRLEELQPDVVLSIGASHKLIAIDPKWKIVHVSDGLFGTMADYYEKFSRFPDAVRRSTDASYQRFLDKTDMVLFASEWARRSALELYRLPAERTRVVPFGANLERDPGAHPRLGDGPLVLLFAGYDWKRKGGELVLATWMKLRERDGTAELHIVGCNPPGLAGMAGVTVHGRLDKSKPADQQRFDKIFEAASFFFMPSRQEAFGMVYCEAAAYGLPAIAARTGGVPTVIEDGVSGILLPLAADADDYVAAILPLWNDKARYRALSVAARSRFETTLNWQAWGAQVETFVTQTVHGDAWRAGAAA